MICCQITNSSKTEDVLSNAIELQKKLAKLNDNTSSLDTYIQFISTHDIQTNYTPQVPNNNTNNQIGQPQAQYTRPYHNINPMNTHNNNTQPHHQQQWNNQHIKQQQTSPFNNHPQSYYKERYKQNKQNYNQYFTTPPQKTSYNQQQPQPPYNQQHNTNQNKTLNSSYQIQNRTQQNICYNCNTTGHFARN